MAYCHKNFGGHVFWGVKGIYEVKFCLIFFCDMRVIKLVTRIVDKRVKLGLRWDYFRSFLKCKCGF